MSHLLLVFVCIFGLSYQQNNSQNGGVIEAQVSESNVLQVYDQNQRPIQESSNSNATNSNTTGFAIYIYIGIGVAIIILFFAIQTCCLIWYFQKVKLRRINEIAQNLSQSSSSDKPRYSKDPSNKAIKKIQTDTNVYESLAELQRAPTPPSLDSLPRIPKSRKNPSNTPVIGPGNPNSVRSQKSTISSHSIKNIGSPNSVRSQKSIISSHSTKNIGSIPARGNDYIKTPSSIRHRAQMPLPHEIPKPETPVASLTRPRPKMLPPNEGVPLATTLPSRIHSRTKLSPSKSNTVNSTQDSGINIELLEKLRKRAEINATLDDNSMSNTLTSQSSTLGSRKPVDVKSRLPAKPPQREPRAQLQMPTRQVQYTGGYTGHESYSSENEWTIEQLEPYNIYNI